MLNHQAQAHMHIGGGSVFDWAATIGGWEWSGDTPALGAIPPAVWEDKVNPARIFQPGAGATKVVGVNGRGAVEFNGTSDNLSFPGTGSLGLNGTNDWCIVSVVEMLAVSTTPGAGILYTSRAIVADTGLRLGSSLVRSGGVGTDLLYGAWLYDGAFQEVYFNVGPTVGGRRVVHMRRVGTQMWVGCNGVEASPVTIGNMSGGLVNLIMGAAYNNTVQTNVRIYKHCGIAGNGVLQTAAISAFVNEFV